MGVKGKKTSAEREPFYYKHREKVVLSFIIAAGVIALSVFVYTFVKTEAFSSGTILYINARSSGGVKPGSPVTMSGINAGYVKSTHISDEGDVIIKIKVRTKYVKHIDMESVAKLKKKNIMVGDWEVSISQGKGFGSDVENGDTLQSRMPVDIERLMEQFAGMVNPMSDVFQSITEGEGIIRHIFGSDTLIDGMYRSMSNIDRLLTEVESLMKHTESVLVQADQAFASVDRFGVHGQRTVDSLMVFSSNADQLIT
ncbi:MAG: MlaD family protein, partial [Chitinivibrionales bacterium]